MVICTIGGSFLIIQVLLPLITYIGRPIYVRLPSKYQRKIDKLNHKFHIQLIYFYKFLEKYGIYKYRPKKKKKITAEQLKQEQQNQWFF
mmetsp:Transcript_105441/g.128681  ORF Transcript_105441/g.128681 Transcript_105441/m.128681 type:complete len:89 (+) Transcript_105441:380-646(+)